MNFLRKLYRVLVWLAIRAAIFLALVWICIGMKPIDTYNEFVNRIRNAHASVQSFFDDVRDTGVMMGAVADHHLQEAKDRTNGIDPYERQNREMDKKVRKDFGR